MKIKLTRVQTIEFEFIPENYPAGTTIEQAAKMEEDCDDRELQFESADSDTVTYEIVGDE